MSEPPTVSGLNIALNDLVNWERFAYYLPGITPVDVEIIKRDKRNDTHEQKLALYSLWLKRYPNGKWKHVSDAKEKAKHDRTAVEQKKKHIETKSPLEKQAEKIDLVKLQRSTVIKLNKLHETFVYMVINLMPAIHMAVLCGKTSIPLLKLRIAEERAFEIPKLKRVQTAFDFHYAIRPYYTFLNCHLLVCVALMLLDPIRAAANEYKKEVDVLKKNTTVKHFKDMLQRYFPARGPKESDVHIPVYIELEETWERANIWLVEELVKKLFDLGHPDECHWIRVQPGSVMVVFLAPEYMMMSMIVSASKRRGLMALLGVHLILVDVCLMIVRDENVIPINPFDLFTSLLHDVQNGYNTTELLLKNAPINLDHTIYADKTFDPLCGLRNQQLNSKNFDEDEEQITAELDKLIPELESEVSSGRLTLDSLVSCVNESIVCPIEGLANVRSVCELFQVIQPYYTFLNNHILQQLAFQLSRIDNTCIYPILYKVLSARMKRAMLSEIMKPLQNYFNDRNVFPNMMKVTLALNDAWQTATMDAVEQLIQFLFNLKHPDELLWHRVRYGSVIIEFLAPKNMMMHLITNSVKQKQLMTLTGVMRLQIGNIVVHKTTQQFSLAESRDESKNLQNTSKVIYEAYVQNHPGTTADAQVDENNNYHFQSNSTISGAHYLMLASIYSDSSLLKLLLECGADPNLCNGVGETALMFASQVGNLRQIELLLSYGANINQQTVKGYTALMIAVYNGNTRIVKFLISANADLYCYENIQGFTAIHIAAQHGHTRVVEILLDAKVDVNICDTINKTTCLHQAIISDSLDTIQLLVVNNKVKVNAQDSLGFTPLFGAALSGNLYVVDALIRANAKTEIAIQDFQMTPLHIASLLGFPHVVERLLEANANKNAQDNFLQTPLTYAIFANNLEVVKILIEAEANPNSENIYQEPSLVFASKKGNMEIVRLLLEGGANLHSHDKHGLTSLHKACGEGHLDVVDFLLKAGINPDTPQDNGTTPLYMACFYGKKTIVERLLKERVDINAKTNTGLTVIQAATLGQHTEIVEILIKAGADSCI